MSTRHIPIDDAGPAVRDVMLTDPRTVGPDTPVDEVRETFANPSVKLLLVAEGERFLGTVVPADVPERGDGTIATLVRADVRRLKPTDAVGDALAIVNDTGAVRIPVVNDDGRVEGLVCFNRSRNAFCVSS